MVSPTAVGTDNPEEEKAPLSEIIEQLNERFGTDFTDEDRLFFEQVRLGTRRCPKRNFLYGLAMFSGKLRGSPKAIYGVQAGSGASPTQTPSGSLTPTVSASTRSSCRR